MLALLLAAVVAGICLFRKSGETAGVKTLSRAELEEVERFNQSVRIDSAQRAGRYRRTFPPSRKQRVGGRVVESFPFNPNTADSATLLRLGLPAWMVGNALKYRRKGGRWRSVDDFRRLYGLTEADYQRLRPYIIIDEADLPRRQLAAEGLEQKETERKYPEKYEEGTVVLDLNTADTAALKGIPGIGSYLARKIVAYREALGGYVSTAQVAESAEGLPEGVERWFRVSGAETPRRFNVNKASFKELVHHPYLSFEQVKEIMNYRQRFGALRDWSDMKLSPYFSPDDFARLAPYSSF